MLFEKLVNAVAADLSKELYEGIQELLEKKKKMEERDRNPRIPVLHTFIEEELKLQKSLIASMPDKKKQGWEMLNHLFLQNLLESRK